MWRGACKRAASRSAGHIDLAVPQLRRVTRGLGDLHSLEEALPRVASTVLPEEVADDDEEVADDVHGLAEADPSSPSSDMPSVLAEANTPAWHQVALSLQVQTS